jgi:DNA-binding response OmpR family regulator
MNASATVLVIDDDALVCEILERKLAVNGYHVVTAPDGAAGLARARVSPPDLIVLDMMMPMMTGREVLQNLRADPQLNQIPVIMLTVRRSEGDVVDALELGAADFVSKPFRPDELVARVSRLLPKPRVVRS